MQCRRSTYSLIGCGAIAALSACSAGATSPDTHDEETSVASLADIPSTPESTPTYSVIHDFTGQFPGAYVLGTTTDGKVLGSVSTNSDVTDFFQLVNPGTGWQYSIIAHLPFGVSTDGPLTARAGGYYGSTYGGGTFNQGSIYELTEDPSQPTGWRLATIYSFPDGKGNPTNLTLGPDGDLYGISYGGFTCTSPAGNTTCGVVYQLAPPAGGSGQWTATYLARIPKNADGSAPETTGAIAIDAAGNLYIATTQGGVSQLGSVEKVSPPAAGATAWTLSTIYSLGTAGSSVQSVVITAAGLLLGDTSAGVLFQLTAPAGGKGPYTYTQLGNAGAAARNGLNQLELAPDGSVYTVDAQSGPTCTAGGFKEPCGQVVGFSPPAGHAGAWKYSVLHTFGGPPADGASPFDIVVDASGAIFGTTFDGGTAGGGVCFELVP